MVLNLAVIKSEVLFSEEYTEGIFLDCLNFAKMIKEHIETMQDNGQLLLFDTFG